MDSDFTSALSARSTTSHVIQPIIPLTQTTIPDSTHISKKIFCITTHGTVALDPFSSLFWERGQLVMNNSHSEKLDLGIVDVSRFRFWPLMFLSRLGDILLC